MVKIQKHPFKGVPRPDDVKDTISKKVKKWLESNEPSMKGKTHTDEVKRKISESAVGRTSPNKDKELSETHRENLSKSQKEWLKNNKHPNLGKTWTYEEVTCPNCGKVGKGPNMKRYHFENCKK